MKIAVAAVLVLIATPSSAQQQFTGQAFLDANEAFATGYAYGIFETEINVVPVTGEFAPHQVRFRECFLGSSFTSGNLYDAVVRHIETNPETLIYPAYVSVNNAMVEICPAKP